MHRDRQQDSGHQGLQGAETGELLHGDRVSVWSDEKFLEMGSGDGCNVATVLNPIELNTLNW